MEKEQGKSQWHPPTAPLDISTFTTSPAVLQLNAAHEQVQKEYWVFSLSPLSQGNGQFAATRVCRASPVTSEPMAD